jgi:cob(I)alamin adenosyltransferase
MRPGKNPAELCYSFIYDDSWLCDYEIATDEIATQLGMAFSAVEADPILPSDTSGAFARLLADLEELQRLALHANGSIRGRLAIRDQDIDWLEACRQHYQAIVIQREPERLRQFVLPRGLPPVPQLHQARSTAKKAIRALVRLDNQYPPLPAHCKRHNIPPLIPRLLNRLCNLCFLLAVAINQQRNTPEPAFISQSYGAPLRS